MVVLVLFFIVVAYLLYVGEGKGFKGATAAIGAILFFCLIGLVTLVASLIP